MRSLDVKSEHRVDVGGEVGEEDDGGEGVANVGRDEGDEGHGGDEGAPRHRHLLLCHAVVRLQRSRNPWGT